jgi:hypothetical protein
MKPKPEKIIPVLPEGIKVAERPQGLEFLQRGNQRWIIAIQALDALDATHCLEIDIAGLTMSKVNGMKAGIKHVYTKLRHKGTIKFAVKGNVLYIWLN